MGIKIPMFGSKKTEEKERQYPVININPEIPPLPRYSDKTKIDVRYVVISPFVSIHIYWDEEKSELLYNIEEPILTEPEKKSLEQISLGMTEMINLGMVENKDQESLLKYLDQMARILISE
ncbi:hypothetical protein J4465_00230, partial [Candidatus Pacearchaeota archaeon]|nr:hypothetical protein [Candidatus Pacearchaeota archaeon]